MGFGLESNCEQTTEIVVFYDLYGANRRKPKMIERRCRGVAEIQNVNKSQNDVIGRPSSIFIRDLFIELRGQILQKSRVDVIKMILF